MSAFDKIIGYENVKNELFQIIDMFNNPEMYEKMGAKLPKGVLIYGEPGMGKSMLANAVIEECGVKSYVLRRNKDDSECLWEIKDTFDQAYNDGKAIIIIDDIDKFSEDDDFNHDDKAFVTMQSCIDKVKDANILVIATANSWRKLPDSLKRNGRFDRKIGLRQPSTEEARKIIEYYMSSKCVDPNLNYDDVSKMISYSSCADLETIINESAIYAAYKRKDKIEMDDIVKAALRDQYNISDDYQCSKEVIRETAIHEAGHAVIADVLKEGSVGLISVASNGRVGKGGYTHLCKEFNRRPENVLIALGGKAAVELFHQGRCGSGCQSDLERAARMIKDGIKESGTSGIGLLSIDPIESSQNLLSMTETVTKAELERYIFIAKDILIKNKDYLYKLTNELEEKYNLLFSDIQRIRDSVEITNVTI